MKSLSLARVLPVLDGGLETPRAEIARLDGVRRDLHVVEFAEPVPGDVAPAPEVETGRRHFEEGYEAGVAVGRAQAQAEMSDGDVLLHDALAAARAEWLAGESERIALGVEKALRAIEQEICSVAARVLAQVVDMTMRERALTEFAENVKTLLRDGVAGVVTVHAPEDLLASLQARLGSLASLEFVPSDTAEVWLRCGATMIETRLDTWRANNFSGE